MPNIQITSSADSVDVVFNDMSPITEIIKGRWRRGMIHSVLDRTTHVEVYLAHGRRWETVHNGSQEGGLIVDTINGVTIDTHAKLFTNLEGLI